MITYTDQADAEAEIIEIESLTTYTPLASDFVTIDNNEDKEIETAIDYKIRIISPNEDESLRSNEGIVNVNVSILPELDLARGDQVTVSIDGEVIGEPSTNTNFTLTNIDRGTHTLQLSVIDVKNRTLSSSDTISFHLLRHSVGQ
jgi:hypothetical protein